MGQRKGVSMVILAVTIVVMAILATTAIIYLEDTGIINKSKQAVKDTNLIQVTELAKAAWNKANSKINVTLPELQQAVNDALVLNRVDIAEYNIVVTTEKVYVSKDFKAPVITNSSMAFTDNTVVVDLSFGNIDKLDYPLTIDYYIKPATITSNEAYSLKKTIVVNSGTTNSYTYTGLQKRTDYNIKAVVRDVNGNIATSTLNVTTSGEPELVKAKLGSMITAANYGDKVNYSVTVNGTVYDDWQIYYHTADHIYLVAETCIEEVALSKGTTVASLTSEELALYDKFRVGDGPKYTLVDKVNTSTAYNSQAVAQLIKDYANFANTADYGSNVVGAIGSPTVELLVAGRNAKGCEPTLTITTNANGYSINGNVFVDLPNDGLYVVEDYWYTLASPCSVNLMCLTSVGGDWGDYINMGVAGGIRPVVCLKSDIQATTGTGDYDFNLVKE